jgi:hypothetical protein
MNSPNNWRKMSAVGLFAAGQMEVKDSLFFPKANQRLSFTIQARLAASACRACGAYLKWQG